ncbi:METTL16/RlmF family [Dillenia turbinata]|uniref:U6 small nuclear RNA (adenine-(43)-N(6))-methyltransferase n=1 Tax=Dillenia turbinata TaxID=194707 RepID=A0AAN8YVI7_9MAGN
MPSKKRKRRGERPTIHPKNRYSDSPPDFSLLASLYPSFKPFVFYTRDCRPRIDWTDFNATRELTRVLLLHDHGLNWWIPDGQLCPTVPNRSNYIHWIEDLLASDIITKINTDLNNVRGFDIGTGANCIYPLVGASLLGWNFVGSDVTDVALEWAEKNVKSNPHISELIEIRKVPCAEKDLSGQDSSNCDGESSTNPLEEVKPLESSPPMMASSEDTNYLGPPILLGVVKDGEKYDFCMCNPPFFESMEEAGLNPRTSCGGTPEEMVCQGGERAFITRIIEDSVKLKQIFRWYTSMVGKKSNLKSLISKLRDVGVTIVKTTEFVQGQTSRWGLAWSFMSPAKKMVFSAVAEKSSLSFMLEGLQRQYSAIHVLQAVESFFQSAGVPCKSNASSFTVDITLSNEQCAVILKNEIRDSNEAIGCQYREESSDISSSSCPSVNDLSLRIAVFQQNPGSLLVSGSLQRRESAAPGAFALIFEQIEELLKGKFCR